MGSRASPRPSTTSPCSARRGFRRHPTRTRSPPSPTRRTCLVRPTFQFVPAPGRPGRGLAGEPDRVHRDRVFVELRARLPLHATGRWPGRGARWTVRRLQDRQAVRPIHGRPACDGAGHGGQRLCLHRDRAPSMSRGAPSTRWPPTWPAAAAPISMGSRPFLRPSVMWRSRGRRMRRPRRIRMRCRPTAWSTVMYGQADILFVAD